MKKDDASAARILLVDDNTRGLTARRMILADHGYGVETALSGEEAWEIFQKNRFDVVVTDLRMGGMDGVELIRWIRATDSPTGIILLSGFVDCLGMTAQSTGADELINKSNKEVPELLRAVEKAGHSPAPRKTFVRSAAPRGDSENQRGASGSCLLCAAGAGVALPLWPRRSARQESARTATAKAAPRKTAAAAPKPRSSRLTDVRRSHRGRMDENLDSARRIAQLIVIGFSGHPMNTRTREYRKFVHLVSQEHVGGLILVNVSNGRTVAKADPLEAASFINRMQRLAKVPLLVSGDFERGASMRVDATTVSRTPWRSPPRAIQRSRHRRRDHRQRSPRPRRPMAFFPDADVNNNPDNPIINIRSYGENPDDVSAFVIGIHRGCALRRPIARSDHRQTLPRSRRHRDRYASEPGHDHGRPDPARTDRVGALPGRDPERHGCQ